MKKIMFSEKFCLEEAVLKGFKTMTRRVATYRILSKPMSGFFTEGAEKGKCCLCENYRVVAKSAYKVGEVVAIAQRYTSLLDKEWSKEDKLIICGKILDAHKKECLADVAGYWNKQYVCASLMPHHIKITNIRAEKLQQISEKDARAEGVRTNELAMENCCIDTPLYSFWNQEEFYSTRIEAFRDATKELMGQFIWNANPWVFVYEFELVD